MRPTCIAVVGNGEVAVGFENSVVLLMKVVGEKLQTLFEIDHKVESQSIQSILTEPNYLTIALNGVGVFKWLCVRD